MLTCWWGYPVYLVCITRYKVQEFRCEVYWDGC